MKLLFMALFWGAAVFSAATKTDTEKSFENGPFANRRLNAASYHSVPGCQCLSHRDCRMSPGCPNRCNRQGNRGYGTCTSAECRCWSDSDCAQQSHCGYFCNRDMFSSRQGFCHRQAVPQPVPISYPTPPHPNPPSDCSCWGDYECRQDHQCGDTCIHDYYSHKYGFCKQHAPQPVPVSYPTSDPNPPSGCSCWGDYECRRDHQCGNTCIHDNYSHKYGFCKQHAPQPVPVSYPTSHPTQPFDCSCWGDYDCQHHHHCGNQCIRDSYGYQKGVCGQPVPQPVPVPYPTPYPTQPYDCSCWGDYDCQHHNHHCGHQCIRDSYSYQKGFCSGTSPTPPPVQNCQCRSSEDCRRSSACPNTCVFPTGAFVGTCQEGRPCECRSSTDCINSPTCPNTCVFQNPGDAQGTCRITTPAPTPVPACCTGERRSVPTECEVELLVNILDMTVNRNKNLIAQWLRLSFHDAGTFDKNALTSRGGANGCLLTDPRFREETENDNLDFALNTLEIVIPQWESDPSTCVSVSNADMIQFVGFFSAVRQTGTPGLNGNKIRQLRENFQWGRVDERRCDIETTSNLPDFRLGTDEDNIPLRCLNAGGEIKAKMIDRNGFTAREANVLIGAHTIGQTRTVFLPGFEAPWVENGDDTATPHGPVFDNAYHKFLVDQIEADSVGEFASNKLTFDETFSTWFRDNDSNSVRLNWLDTDVVLAFPPHDVTVHPNFLQDTHQFANNNQVFLDEFMRALDKMSRLGVTARLFNANSCDRGCPTVPGNGHSFGSGGFRPTSNEAFFSELDAALARAQETIDERAREDIDNRIILTTPIG